MPATFTAYVDEAGDEGFGKLRAPGVSGQSRWFVLGAVVVRAQNDVLLPAWRDEVLARFPSKQSRDLHFRNLKHEQKVVACQTMAAKPLGICVVASCKETILDLPKAKLDVFKQPQHLYNYLVRYLLERLSSACRRAADRDGIGTPSLRIVFSRRSSTDYESMKGYLRLIRDGREVLPSGYRIDWRMIDIDRIEVENHSKRAGLQLADVATSAVYTAIEPNIYGNFESGYAGILAPRLLRRTRNVLGVGLTTIPPPERLQLHPEQRKFIESLKRNEQAPGS